MDFLGAAKAVVNLSQRPSNEILLQLYALYKQGAEGDVQGNRPGMLDLKGRAKFDAWKKLVGMSQHEAQRRYIELVESLLRQNPR